MAKVQNNIFIRGLSGSLGDQFVIRKGKAGSTIIAAKAASNPDRTFNADQLAHQDAFREAIAYAKSAKDEPIYIAKAEGTTKSSFNVAVADWFKAPVVHEIDASGWNGGIGQTIQVKAQDEIHVAKVHVEINGENGTLLEQGDAVQADGLWWTYTTTTVVSNPATSMIVATAQDLARNTAELMRQGQ